MISKPHYLLLAFGLLLGGLCQAKDHVVIVLDGSGSMTDPMRNGTIKMRAAKDAISRVLDALPQDTEIGLLVFSNIQGQPDWVVPLGPVDRRSFRNRLNQIRAKGGTPLGHYLKIGADKLMQAREANLGYGTYRLLVVTDGQAGDPERVEAFAPQIRNRNINLDVIGVAMNRAHILKRTANSYRRADDPRALEEAVSEVLAEVSANGREGALAYEEAFDILSGIPDEAAIAMVQGITTVNNDPIGMTRNVPQGSGKAAIGRSGSNQHYNPTHPNHPPAGTRRSGGNGFWRVLIFFFIAVFVLPQILKGK